MRELRWKLSKARIWLDELPAYEYQAIDTSEQGREVSTTSNVISQACAIELVHPVGARAYYGALGATFLAQGTGRFVVQVPISADKGRLLDTSLAGKIDEVHIGLPREYVNGVLSGFMDDESIQQLGAGTLCVCCAAHGSVGSSIVVFRALSRVLAHLFVQEKASLSDEYLIELIRRELSRK